MARWQPDTRERLERAAVELFTEQGFAETTVPEIAARAGVTTRTFFRHFADKREVLFGGETAIPARVAQLMADAPAALGPMELIIDGLATVATTLFEGRRDHLRARRAFVETDDGLHERDLRKFADLTDAIGEGFRHRGEDALTAALAARIAVTALQVTLTRWLDTDPEQPLQTLLTDTIHSIRVITR